MLCFTLATPYGVFTVAMNDQQSIVASGFVDEETMTAYLSRRYPSTPVEIASEHTYLRQLKNYFNGELNALKDIPVAPTGTPFQLQVWEEMRRIPTGHVATYAEIAKQINRPNAVRAVGSSCARNPIVLFTPCHRVVQSNGYVGEYLYGIARKTQLLRHEGCILTNRNFVVQ